VLSMALSNRAQRHAQHDVGLLAHGRRAFIVPC